VFFVVAGKEKADAVRRTLAPEGREEPTPAARVAPRNGQVIWVLDREAASSLPRIVAQTLGPGRR